jgi:hypothetical protein
LRHAIRGNPFSREDNAQSVDADPAPVNLGELVWAGLVFVAITAGLALNCLEPGPSSGGSQHGIASVIRARELLKSLVEQRQEARSRVDITPLRIR